MCYQWEQATSTDFVEVHKKVLHNTDTVCKRPLAMYIYVYIHTYIYVAGVKFHMLAWFPELLWAKFEGWWPMGLYMPM